MLKETVRRALCLLNELDVVVGGGAIQIQEQSSELAILHKREYDCHVRDQWRSHH